MSDIPRTTPEVSDNIMILQPVRADEVGRRGPGRPRTKVRPEDVLKPAPSSGAIKPDEVSLKDVKDEEARRKLKKQKKDADIQEVKEKIIVEINEQILDALVSVGFPSEFLYKTPPRSLVVDSNYTELGNALCINPRQANWIAHGYVEAKEVPAIKKLLGENKTDGPSYFWLVLGGLGLLSYGNQLRKAMGILQGYKESIERAAQIAAQQAQENGGVNRDTPAFSEEN